MRGQETQQNILKTKEGKITQKGEKNDVVS